MVYASMRSQLYRHAIIKENCQVVDRIGPGHFGVVGYKDHRYHILVLLLQNIMKKLLNGPQRPVEPKTHKIAES